MEELHEPLAQYLASRPQPPGKMSFTEFLNWCDEDTWAEWVDGEVIILTPASLRHQEIKMFLAGIMSEFTRYHHLGRVIDAPFVVRLPGNLKRGREPDIIVIRTEQLPLLKETYFDGSPDVIVEIISPESYARDRLTKYHEYETAGVKEYWLLDPDQHHNIFYRLGEDDSYHPVPYKEGIFYSEALPGFWLKPAWLWQKPLPSLLTVMSELGIK